MWRRLVASTDPGSVRCGSLLTGLAGLPTIARLTRILGLRWMDWTVAAYTNGFAASLWPSVKARI